MGDEKLSYSPGALDKMVRRGVASDEVAAVRAGHELESN